MNSARMPLTALAFVLVCLGPAAKTLAGSRDSAAMLYAHRCAGCHGAGMEGADDAPPLIGPRFRAKWSGQPMEKLAEKIERTMPQDDPGTLRPSESRALARAISAANPRAASRERPSL